MDRSSTTASHGSGSAISSADRRAELYDKMARDLDEKGAAFLKGGETSQSLSLTDLFQVKDGSVTPKLKAADPPVRATVLYLSPEFSIPISLAVKEIFLPYFDGNHRKGKEDEVEGVATVLDGQSSRWLWSNENFVPVEQVSSSSSSSSTRLLEGVSGHDQRRQQQGWLKAASTWQLKKVISGTDPIMIRAKLKNALPRAPDKQLYDPVLLHTSFARLLGQPKEPAEVMKKVIDQPQFFHELVAQLNDKLRGLEVTVSEIWYVEEYDVLALALNGRMKAQKFRLGCSHN